MLQLVEVTDLKTKKLCHKKFCKAYKNVNPPSSHTYGKLRKYLLAYVDQKPVGFIVLSDKSSFYEGLETWCASEAFVEPKHRSKGYLREMLEIAIRDHKVRLAYIEQKRFWENANYYMSLGFCMPVGSKELVYVRLARDVPLMDMHRRRIRSTKVRTQQGASQ